MVAVSSTGPQMGLQSRWYRQQRSPQAPGLPEPDETPDSPCSDGVNARFHLALTGWKPGFTSFSGGLTLHDQLNLSGMAFWRTGSRVSFLIGSNGASCVPAVM
jgi:hypothetical protein